MVEKGRKQQLKTGDEAGAASRYARSIVPFGRGELKQIKRRMNKRLRRVWREEARAEL